MKKIIVIVFILCIILSLIIIQSNIFKPTITLDDLVNEINTNNPMADYLKESYGSTFETNVDNNKLIFTIYNAPFSDGGVQTVELFLENNILSTTLSKDKDTTEYMVDLSLVWMIVDCIGQINGYEKEQFYETIKGTGSAYEHYTLEKDGLEIKHSDNNTTVKINLSKKIKIIETSDT